MHSAASSASSTRSCAHPHVMAGVHSHSPVVIPFRVVRMVSLPAVSNMGSFPFMTLKEAVAPAATNASQVDGAWNVWAAEVDDR